jgi:hypothetical protein
MIGRILLALAVLAVTGFVFLVLIGLWDRYEQEITAGLSRIYERYLAWQAGFSGDAPTRTFQQLPKLVGTGAVGSTNQGMSVALSADGNTAIGVWTQQGKKLVGSDAVGSARQGMSVALSADGNTAILGGPGDNPWARSVPFGLGAAGAAWVFTRSAGVWTQQGNKLVSTGAVGRQGTSVALSADGNIAIVGGFADDGGVALVFTCSGGHWTQDKNLVGTGAVGKSAPSVALSADGSIVMVGGSNDNGGIGAAWMFTRSGGYWTEDKGPVGTGVAAKVAPSASVDRSIVMVGRSNDNGGAGAATVFTRRGGGSDSQELARPSTTSNPAVNFEE